MQNELSHLLPFEQRDLVTLNGEFMQLMRHAKFKAAAVPERRGFTVKNISGVGECYWLRVASNGI